MKYALYSFQLLVTCTHVELCSSMQYVWFLKAVCSVKSCHHILVLLELELYSVEFPYNAAKMYGGMLKIGLQPSRSTESRLQIQGYINGSQVCHEATFLLLLWS
jgi:hypothetical protein